MRSPRALGSSRLPRSGDPLGPAAHIGYAASLALHIGLGVIAILIAVVTALSDNLATNERLDVNQAQLGLAVFLWVVALAALGVLWARRSHWGWLAPLIWALIGLPLAVTHAQIETVPPLAACATDGRVVPGLSTTDVSTPPPVAWCYEADSPIHEVAVLDDAVYLASTAGTLTVLDRSSGTVRWDSLTGTASAAIVAWDDAVIGGDGERVTAWNASGQQRWTAKVPAPITALAARPAGAVDEVYIACADGTVLALDTATGAVRWQSLTPVPDALLAVSGHELYAFNTARTITISVLDAREGEVLGAWIYDLGPQSYLTPPVLAGTMLVAGYEIRSDDGTPLTGGAIGMDPVSGAVVWDRPLEAPVQIAPVNVGGTVNVLAVNGQLYRLEPLSGQETRPREIVESRGLSWQNANRLLAADGVRVFIVQQSSGVGEGNVYGGVVTATDNAGSALWRFHLIDPPTLPVTIAGNITVVPDNDALFAVRNPGPATPAATPVQ